MIDDLTGPCRAIMGLSAASLQTRLASRLMSLRTFMTCFCVYAIGFASMSFGSCGGANTPPVSSHRIVLQDERVAVIVPVRYELLSQSYRYGIRLYLIGDRTKVTAAQSEREAWEISIYDKGVQGPFGLGTASGDEILAQVKDEHQRAGIQLLEASTRTIDGASAVVVTTKSPSYQLPPWVGHEAYGILSDGRSFDIVAQLVPAVVAEGDQQAIFDEMLKSLLSN